ncbi:mCG147306 [Mus musculus]|nr:mCG147306 [Mus musculus]
MRGNNQDPLHTEPSKLYFRQIMKELSPESSLYIPQKTPTLYTDPRSATFIAAQYTTARK